ncbi:hypothetical protein M422DRAFT_56765 [Sphaerobolus stellatus SS14]|uniref:Unplaced genomic scaffold SPHSTscaffold_544, whole genome shotgun sequence n=1 Tax=Sphaerobolus stellatus (strain SS14) TaxID=990650 RepID=A0A0C9TP08_SPHS4|nr:hypothetical protein M422DRAFT_56765 [Sphaerobolus stellatus SS14]
MQSGSQMVEASSDNDLDEDNEELQRALFLSSLPSDIFDEQVAALNANASGPSVEAQTNITSASKETDKEHFSMTQPASQQQIPRPSHNVAHSISQDFLADLRFRQFRNSGEITHLNEAIAIQQQVIKNTPDCFSWKLKSLMSLAMSFHF